MAIRLRTRAQPVYEGDLRRRQRRCLRGIAHATTAPAQVAPAHKIRAPM
jgi:hypothetical protein